VVNPRRRGLQRNAHARRQVRRDSTIPWLFLHPGVYAASFLNSF
jgi:hypothetical protein